MHHCGSKTRRRVSLNTIQIVDFRAGDDFDLLKENTGAYGEAEGEHKDWKQRSTSHNQCRIWEPKQRATKPKPYDATSFA